MDFWHMQLDYPQEADVRVKPYSHPFYLLFLARITPSKFRVCVRWNVLAKNYKIRGKGNNFGVFCVLNI